MVAVIDAPSDRQSPPYLGGFRQKPEQASDIKAVILEQGMRGIGCVGIEVL